MLSVIIYQHAFPCSKLLFVGVNASRSALVNLRIKIAESLVLKSKSATADLVI